MTMPMEDYPHYVADGDEVYGRLKQALTTSKALDPTEVEPVGLCLAAFYEKALELGYAVDAMARTDPQNRTEMADLIAFAEIASDILSQWHEENAGMLIRVVDQLRGQHPSGHKAIARSKKKVPKGGAHS